MNKRISSLLLALLTTSSIALTACSSGDGTSTDTTTADTTPEVTTEYVEPDRDFGGEEFTIWYRHDGDWSLTDLYVEEENGDILNDSVYERNLEVETRFNVDFKGVASQTVGTDDTDTKVLTALILSGEDVYDVLVPSAFTCATLIRNKMLLDFNDIPNIDLDNEWWDQNIRRVMSIKGKQFIMSSDLSVINARAAAGIYFNRDIAESLGVDAAALFESATNGTWTFEQMMETGKPATMDLNGDGQMTEVDRYAFLNSNNAIKIIHTACDVMITGKNPDDTMTFVLDTERSISALTYLIEDVISNENTFNCSRDSEKPNFIAGRGMFTYMNILHLENMRSEEFNFSLLPMPKYDEQQERYLSQAQAWCTSFLSVPITTQNLDMTGYILEKASEISSRTLVPTYFDVAITTKYSRDEESIAMLEIIFDTITHEPADLFRFGKIIGELGTAMKSGGNVTSVIESNKASTVASIDELNNLFG